ncbi:hypothetical protein [Streptomyces sp. SP18CS02]|uniref:hypothetical protein n=1 Tax=Streptomyces sp. SP18CS02 TaxID=3002531 RepID=UPI002E768D87|nr:hypothetical protein [Streptomyces sp. SP18CS02]MEE1752970.1 hypothetical protein [Streptomyces sp. SP18CS02]
MSRTPGSHGASGRPEEYGTHKTIRDPRVRRILEGTEEIMNVVARSLTEHLA